MIFDGPDLSLSLNLRLNFFFSWELLLEAPPRLSYMRL